MFSEYPKWVRSNGRAQIASDAAQEQAILSLWAAQDAEAPVPAERPAAPDPAPVANALIGAGAAPSPPKPVDGSAFDHDGDGKPGGSLKGAPRRRGRPPKKG